MTNQKELGQSQINTLTSQKNGMSTEGKCRFCGKDLDYITSYTLPPANASVPGVCGVDACAAKAREIIFDDERIYNLLSYLEIPLRYRRKFTFQRDTTEIIKDILQGRGVYLYGNAGVGKTAFACHILKEAWRAYASSVHIPFYISLPKLIMQLQDKYHKDGESPYELLEEICDKWLIVLDDLGAEKLTGFVHQSLYLILNEREQRMKVTIITSNYSLDELAKRLDDRIASRITGMCKVIKMNGKDRRG